MPVGETVSFPARLESQMASILDGVGVCDMVMLEQDRRTVLYTIL